MDLMTLAAKLTLDDSGFRSGISNAESMGERLTGKMSAMTVAAGNIMSDIIKRGFNAVTGMMSSAIDSFGDYQQLIGGVETLFKGSADKVAAYAKESFKTTGLSANGYMETVTSFSASLLQGLKGDTEEAAELANMAVTDMADNANKMGTDLSSIQTAYQGFAKQNFTMLDNLKLGYGGTKEEMVRLINDSGILNEKIDSLDGITFDQIIAAIHKIQEEMGITGTTAEEAAQTISGSKASLKAAWEDMLSAVGGEGGQARLDETLENFKTAFSTYMDNFIPTLTTTIVNSGTLVETIADAIASLPTDSLSKIAQGAFGTVEGVADGAKSLVTWIIESITQLFRDISADPEQIIEMGQAIGEFIGSALSDIVSSAPTIISGLFTAGVSLAGSLIEGLFAGLFGNDEGINAIFKDADKDMADSIENAEKSSVKAQGIIGYMDSLVEKYGNAAKDTDEWATALEKLEEVMPGATQYIKEQDGALSTTVKNLQAMREQLRLQAIENAKRKALQTKEDAYLDLMAQVSVKEYDIEMAESGKSIAAENLAKWFDALYEGAGVSKRFNAEEWENSPAGLKGEIDRLLDFYAKDSNGNPYDKDSEEYKVMKAQLHGWAEALTGTDSDIESMRTELEELKTQLADAQAEYEQATASLSRMNEAAAGAAAGLASIHVPSIASLFGGSLGNAFNGFMPRAVGIDYAPYDGFRTELHRGEAIITREENAKRSAGMDQIAMEAALESAVRAGMSGVYFNMDGNRVADLTTQRTQNNISGNERSRIRAMGG